MTKLPITVFLIYDMSAQISDVNIDIINSQNGTNYPYGVTYQNLYDSREHIGSERGIFRVRKSDQKTVWVLPDMYYGIETEQLSPEVGIQVSREDYINTYEPLFEEIEGANGLV